MLKEHTHRITIQSFKNLKQTSVTKIQNRNFWFDSTANYWKIKPRTSNMEILHYKCIVVPIEKAMLLLFLGGRVTTLLVMLPCISLVPQKLRVHLHTQETDFKNNTTEREKTYRISRKEKYPFRGGVAMPLGFLDAILVSFVGLVVCCVIL